MNGQAEEIYISYINKMKWYQHILSCLGVIIGVLQAVAMWANSEIHCEEKF